ncbi:MAG: hypothetical protein AMJ90_08460 [candidate division Zixibacteria bacterium SM23_73_2]|nr:MAG: hypothetical protein AMJ90_08460 [candidate division Zixibacteria bacterium SM23_73_2]
MNKKTRYKSVISASRRVDLLTFYPDFMVERLEKIGKENIHTLVIWTKNPENILKHKKLNKTLKSLDQVYVLLTITGLGGTELEPNAPSNEKVLQLLPKLIDFLGSSKRLAIRYDPLLDVYYKDEVHLTNIDMEIFKNLLKDIKGSGIERVITSYITLYPKVVKRLEKNNFRVVPHSKDEIENFIQKRMIPLCEKENLKLNTCVLPDLTTTGCIEGKLLSELHPEKERCSLAKDQSQRPNCHCTKSLDIGEWFSCYHGCFYCYGNPHIPELKV